MAAYSLVLETEDKDLILTRLKTLILKTYLMLSENPKICLPPSATSWGWLAAKPPSNMRLSMLE